MSREKDNEKISKEGYITKNDLANALIATMLVGGLIMIVVGGLLAYC